MSPLQSGDELHKQSIFAEFPDKLEEVHLLFRITDWNFPLPGWYDFSVYVDGELLTQRKLEVRLREEDES